MAILKYTDANGITHSVNSYKINNVIVTQEKGESTADVMSQKAVTDEIKKVNSLIPTKVSQLTNDKNYLTQHQSLADYAKTVDVYTKGDIDTKVTNINSSITAEQSRATTAENKIKTDLTTEINKKVATVTIEKDSTNDLQYHLIVDGEKTGDINIPKDQFLSNVVYSSATKVITFTFETSTGTTTTDVNISDLIDTYTAGNGLTLTDGKFSVKKDTTSQAYIEVSASGVKVVGIDEALANKVDNTTYATDKSNINTSINTVSDNLTAETSRATGVEDGIKAEVAKKANTTDVNTSLDKKLDKTTYTTDKATYALKSDVATELNKKANSSDVYTTAQVDEKVNVKANAADVYTRDEIDTLTATMDAGEF